MTSNDVLWPVILDLAIFLKSQEIREINKKNQARMLMKYKNSRIAAIWFKKHWKNTELCQKGWFLVRPTWICGRHGDVRNDEQTIDI